MITKQIDNKTAKEKADFVNGKVAYWPKSILGRFAELEKTVQSEREENKKFRNQVTESMKKLLK
jgi:hypothetical protein|tara:strand:+ start:367 stop:558 length:192 start_codon:yes stop_codon:yes gene_type:complete